MKHRPPPDAYLRTLLLCLLAGGVLASLGLALGWMIGAMIAAAYLARRQAAAVPRLLRPAGLVVLGLALGQGCTPPVLAAVAGELPAILAGGLLSLLVALAAAPLYRRLARTDARTALLAAIPGGVGAMADLATRAGASVMAVTLAQSVRNGLLTLTYPVAITLLATGAGLAGAKAFAAAPQAVSAAGLAVLLAGGVLAAVALEWTRLPNATTLGPCLLAIVLSGSGALPSAVPGWLLDAAQFAIGASLGQHLAREGLGGTPRRLVLATTVTAAAMTALLAAAGVAVALLADLPVLAAVLGTAPGGMPEMTLTAAALDLAVPLVLGFHLVRMLLSSILLGLVWRRFLAPGGGR